MHRHHLITLCMVGIAQAALPGCASRTVVHEQPVVVKESQAPAPIIVQSETMPAPRVENPGPPPSSGQVWVAGHWEKSDRGWVWQSGHWEQR